MSWNYRVMRRIETDSDGTRRVTLAIHEVYYRDGVVDDTVVSASDTGYSENPAAPLADDIEGLRWVLNEMLSALDKPVLEHS